MAEVFARSVARALEDHLCAQEASAVHWVQVMGEASLDRVPTKLWPEGDPMFVFTVLIGHSEGILVEVSARHDRYGSIPDVGLLRVKLLCSMRSVGPELAAMEQFFHYGPLQAILQNQRTAEAV